VPSQASLRVIGWESSSDSAIVYLPGFNASLEHALKSIGQLLCLGEFPHHFKPFVFSWPCGRELTYFPAKRMAECAETAGDLKAMLCSLRAGGLKRLHVISHSMGARVLLHALDVMTAERIKLTTCTIFSPDASYARFVETDWAKLRRLCKCVTLFADQADGALRYSEMFNRERSLGRHPFELGSGSMVELDVVDTSWMDSNVQALRHSYFNVNRHIIDDLREIIVETRKAHLRTSRLLHRRGNVFSFLAAPRRVVNE